MGTAALAVTEEDLNSAVERSGATDLTIIEQARALRICDQAPADLAGEILATVQARRKKIAAELADSKGITDRAHKTVCALERRLDTPWKEVEVEIKREIGDYHERCEAERREQERRAAIERLRLERIAQQAAEAERVRLQKEEEDKRLELAAISESVGDTEGAARIIAETPVIARPDPVIEMPAPIAVAPQAKVPGASVRKVWKHRILNAKAITRPFLEPNGRAIADAVKSLGPDAVAVVGAGSIEVFEERQVAGRAR